MAMSLTKGWTMLSLRESDCELPLSGLDEVNSTPAPVAFGKGTPALSEYSSEVERGGTASHETAVD
jgi:hypothetical protein